MTLAELTADIVAINDARVLGNMSREDHAVAIARCYRIMAGYGWTWADIERTHNDYPA
jgi:hypothetical protein